MSSLYPKGDVRTSKTFLEAEESFLKAQRGEPTVEPIPNFTPRVREKDRPRKLRKFRPVVEARKALSKMGTVEFFKSILSDEVEKQLWMAFITGTAPKIEGGRIVKDEQGNVVMEEIALDPISWNAFRRAVEYKRGMPLVTVEDGTKGQSKTVEVIMIGSNPKLFQEQAEAQGLLGIRKPPIEVKPNPELLEDSKV